MINKKFGIASTIYNLEINTKKLNERNYDFKINDILKIVSSVYFIDEHINVLFGEITGKELFKWFSTS
tara:strand:+ start:7700 stop:7903 length:204 start_codon:yes stop_codon:yes gene_type:complete